MNSKTFTKRVNETLKEIIKDALEYERDPNYRRTGVNPYVDVNKTRIWFNNLHTKNHTIEFMCFFNPKQSAPKDIAKLILFGLTVNHVIEVTNDKTGNTRYFKIEDVNYVTKDIAELILFDLTVNHVDDYDPKLGTYLLVTVVEVIGLETGTLPNGQTVYKPILPQQ